MGDGEKDRFPRGAIAVVLGGLLLSVAVAWLSDEDLVASRDLAWAESRPGALPAAGPVPLGAGGSLAVSTTGFDVSAPNSAGERLFQVGATLVLDPGPGGSGPLEAACRVETEAPAVNARTPSRPAAFPGVIDDLSDAEWPGEVAVNHSAQGSPFSTVSLPAGYEGYGTAGNVAVEWGEWRSGEQLWAWTVPPSTSGRPARLRFVSLWRTLETPAARLSCAAETAAGEAASVSTEGRIAG